MPTLFPMLFVFKLTVIDSSVLNIILIFLMNCVSSLISVLILRGLDTITHDEAVRFNSIFDMYRIYDKILNG